MKKLLILPVMFLLASGVYGQEKIYEKADKMPEISGGITALAENIVYPEEARENKIEGKVLVEAVIDKNGNVESAKSLNNVGSGLDEAAVDAVKKTQFTPGVKDGKNVKCKVVIPIKFALN